MNGGWVLGAGGPRTDSSPVRLSDLSIRTATPILDGRNGDRDPAAGLRRNRGTGRRLLAPAPTRPIKSAKETITMKGVVKNTMERGFGFITADDGRDYFFHRSGIDGIQFCDL